MPPRPSPLTPEEVLAREFLPIRAGLLDLAAALDRLERAAGVPLSTQPEALQAQIGLIHQALHLMLESDSADRAERTQQLFSREYDPQWFTDWIASQEDKA